MQELECLSLDLYFREKYEAHLKVKNDEISAITVATRKGREEGREEGKIETALAYAERKYTCWCNS